MKQKMKLGMLVLVVLTAAIFLLREKLPKFEKISGKAVLSWEIDQAATGYKIYWGESPRTADCPSGGYANNLEAGKVGQYEFTNLVPGKTYYFSITALGAGGKESCFSPESQKEIPPKWKIFFDQFFGKKEQVV